MNEQTIPYAVDLTATAALWIGARGGRTAWALLELAVQEVPAAAEIVALDFAPVTLVTASAVRECALPCIALLLKQGHRPVLANLDESGKDEVHLAAEASKTAVACADLHDGRLTKCQILGLLDAKLAETLGYVVSLAEADAKAVSALSGEHTVVTVWNNRLVALHSLGLLTERKVGRTKFYAPLVEGMRYGR